MMERVIAVVDIDEQQRKEKKEMKDLFNDPLFAGAEFFFKAPAEKWTDEIAAHEAGHCVALVAAGLADEFVSATIVPQGGVQGLTVRSGESLARLSMGFAEHAARLGDLLRLEEAKRAFREFLMTAPEVCLPHLCFYFGGGSMDRYLQRDNPARNSVDMNVIGSMVVPAMAIPAISVGELAEIQKKVDEFLWMVFDDEDCMIEGFYDELCDKRVIDRSDFDQILKGSFLGLTDESHEKYSELLSWFRDWHARKLESTPFV